LTLLVEGSRFGPTAAARWNGRDITAKRFGSTLIEGRPALGNFDFAGPVRITVSNEAAGGGVSLPYESGASAPLSIQRLSSALARRELRVVGAGFTPTTVVLNSGVAAPTRHVSPTELAMLLPPGEDGASFNAYRITVFDIGGVGGQSNRLVFCFSNEPPLGLEICPADP